MNAPPHSIEPGRDQIVTSSDLVRHFGIWQDRATRSPVYVLQRGRPRFVLTTIEVMEALCAGRSDGGAAPAATDHAIVDMVSDLVVIADRDLRIVHANHAARSHYGDTAATGRSVGDLTAQTAGIILADAARRVAMSGMPEMLDLPSPTYPSRVLAVNVAPRGGGVIITARDATIAADLAHFQASDQAQRQALAAMRDVAAVRINLRGYLELPDASLTALTGLTAEALASVRFVSLIDISSRATIGAAIEAVIAGGDARAADALLLVNRSASVPVRIGLAALRQHGAVRGITALIARTAFSD